jgi:outer membrane protein assembly factor BamB
MAAVALYWLLVVAAPDENGRAVWPGFLGGGKAECSPQMPTQWREENIAWQQELPGYGQSSPIVWDGQVVVTSIEGPRKEKCHVIALRLEDGAVAWKYSLPAAEQAENNNYTSKAAPTPVTDGEDAFVLFESGDVVALSRQGKERWKRSLSADYGKFTTRHGLAASPILVDNALVLLLDHEGQFADSLDCSTPHPTPTRHPPHTI